MAQAAVTGVEPLQPGLQRIARRGVTPDGQIKVGTGLLDPGERLLQPVECHGKTIVGHRPAA